MSLFSRGRAWIRAIRDRDRLDADLHRELGAWVDELAARYETEGSTSDEARRLALLETEGVECVKETVRDQRIGASLDTLLRDLRFAARMWRAHPWLAATAILSLALGIGANTAIFSVIDNLFFRPPRFAHIDQLVYIHDTNPEKVPTDVEVPPSPGNVLDWRERSRSFDYIALWRNWYYAVRGSVADPNPAESVRGARVSAGFFRMLGIEPLFGRTFRDDEAIAGRDQVVLLSHRFWRSRFGSDPTIIGRDILVDGRPRTVVGVLRPDFQFLQRDLELWLPLAEDGALRDRQNHSTMVFARLASNVTLTQAQLELDGITAQLAVEHPETNTGWGARLVPLYPTREVRDVRPALVVLLGASGCVLLIACVNTANLLLGRATARVREMAIRAAVGASRGRLIRQMLTECVLLAVAGGAAGTLVALWGVHALVPLMPHAGTNEGMGTFGPMIPALNGRVLAFSIASALATGVLFGLVPAYRSTRSDSLRLSSTSAHCGLASRWLMIAELTLAITLLIGTALLVKSFRQLQDVHPGFKSDHLLTLQVWLPRTKYPEPQDARTFFDALLERLTRLPGVHSAGTVSFRPFLGMAMTTPVDVPGRAPRGPADVVSVGYDVVSPAYLRVLGQPLMKGRDLADTDSDTTFGAVIVNETMARRLWPGEDPIGKQILPGFARTDVPWAVDVPPRWLTVVGLAADIKEFRANEQPRPLMYVSSRQFPSSFMYVLVRTDGAPEALATSVQREIRALDPDEPISNVQTMEQAIAQSLPRFNVALMGLFAAIAWLLAAIGVYGVTSYAVAQRRREFGIRMALGASARDMLSMVLGETLKGAAIAVACGALGGLAVSRTMTSLLYGVSPHEPRVLIAVAGTLLTTVVVAAIVPARRAAAVDPVHTLKAD
jgi:putative ABC transport system permease protein